MSQTSLLDNESKRPLHPWTDCRTGGILQLSLLGYGLTPIIITELKRPLPPHLVLGLLQLPQMFREDLQPLLHRLPRFFLILRKPLFLPIIILKMD